MIKKFFAYGLLLFIAVLLTGCAGIGAGLDNFFIKFSTVSGTLTKLVTSIAYLMGLMFAFRAVFALKVYGEMRTMMSSNANIKAPMLYFLVSAVLMYLPTAAQVVNSGIFGSGNPIAYSSFRAGSAVLSGVYYFVAFIGLISFIRGWLYIAGMAQQGQHHPGGKAFTHIVGGVLAMNIKTTIAVLQSTFISN